MTITSPNRMDPIKAIILVQDLMGWSLWCKQIPKSGWLLLMNCLQSWNQVLDMLGQPAVEPKTKGRIDGNCSLWPCTLIAEIGHPSRSHHPWIADERTFPKAHGKTFVVEQVRVRTFSERLARNVWSCESTECVERVFVETPVFDWPFHFDRIWKH